MRAKKKPKKQGLLKKVLRSKFLLPIALVLAIGIFRLIDPKATPLCAHTVSDGVVIHVSDSGFDPKHANVETGQKVIFENSGFSDVWPASDDHPTHTKYSALDPRNPVLPGETWEFVFDKPGDYGLHDHLMPQNIGHITVTGESKNCQQSGEAGKKVVGQLNTQTTLPEDPNPSVASLIAAVKSACQTGDSKCQETEIGKIIAKHGPMPALQVYGQLLADSYIPPEGDGHQFAHRIGRKTAEQFGVGYETFDLCTTKFNYGCQHGYFEYVLGRTDTSKQAIETICSQVGPGKALKAKFYCYHGAGHGVMMAEANDLDRSLQACDQLGIGEPQSGCWQGVFMENVNAQFRGEAQAGIFDPNDPLAPCNKLDLKYRTECYQNHAAWMVRNTADVSAATSLCLNADNDHVDDCITSIGLMTTNPGWQMQLLPNARGSLPQIAWQICQKFPASTTGTCVIAAVANLANFDQRQTSRMVELCQIVDAVHQTNCRNAITAGIRSNSASADEMQQACHTLPTSWREACTSAGY